MPPHPCRVKAPSWASVEHETDCLSIGPCGWLLSSLISTNTPLGRLGCALSLGTGLVARRSPGCRSRGAHVCLTGEESAHPFERGCACLCTIVPACKEHQDDEKTTGNWIKHEGGVDSLWSARLHLGERSREESGETKTTTKCHEEETLARV